MGIDLTDDDSPRAYFENIIPALAKKAKSKVVIIIDEYDAPVTENIGNQEVAEANADVLRKFLGTLKKVTDSINFTFVTGITRYGLTSMDSGPNHFVDISIDDNFAGICGFTMEEFEPLFADRMEETLACLKEIEQMPPGATVENLKEEIRVWYDDYNWGRKTRVLNPYSILNFFIVNLLKNIGSKADGPGI